MERTKGTESNLKRKVTQVIWGKGNELPLFSLFFLYPLIYSMIL